MQTYNNHTVLISVNELENIIEKYFDKKLNEFFDKLEKQVPNKQQELITIEQAMKKLDVCKGTLRNWHRSGKLRKISINGSRKKYYRTEDINKIIGIDNDEK